MFSAAPERQLHQTLLHAVQPADQAEATDGAGIGVADRPIVVLIGRRHAGDLPGARGIEQALQFLHQDLIGFGCQGGIAGYNRAVQADNLRRHVRPRESTRKCNRKWRKRRRKRKKAPAGAFLWSSTRNYIVVVELLPNVLFEPEPPA